MMRSFDYARTPPEPPEGLVLVVVLVVALIMGPDLWARISLRQPILPENPLTPVEQDAIVTR